VDYGPQPRWKNAAGSARAVFGPLFWPAARLWIASMCRFQLDRSYIVIEWSSLRRQADFKAYHRLPYARGYDTGIRWT
jgi:hypothetical protein